MAKRGSSPEGGREQGFGSAVLRGTSAAVVTSAALIAQQVAGKAVRDALFLSSFHTTSLPRVMAAGAVLSLLMVVWLSRLMARFSPRRVMPVLFAVSASAFLTEWVVSGISARVAAVAVYLHTALFGPVMISAFWSLINERFDPHTAKTAVSRIAGGGTLGGVLGGIAAWRASSVFELPTLVLFLALTNAGCMVGTILIGSPPTTGEVRPPIQTLQQQPVHDASALGEFRAAPFLRSLALLVVLGAATSSLLDYVFSVEATAAYGKGQPLLAFFSLFWLAVSVFSLALQLTLGRIAMEKLSLAVNIAVLPGLIIMGGAFGLAVPGLISASVLRGSEAVQRNTLFRSAYELLYAPLAEDRKRVTKAVIDVGFDRLGTVIGSGLAVAAFHLFAHGSSAVLLGVVVVLAIATLPVTRQLQVGYVAALEQGLREGAQKLALPPPDAPRQTHVELEERLNRDELIEHVEELKEGEDGSAATGPACDTLRHPEPLLAHGRELLSRDLVRVRRALQAVTEARIPVVHFAILLLAHKELHVDATQALRTIASRATGQLIDALLDLKMDYVVRRRIPRVLAGSNTQRAADGLLLGLADDRFEIRYACGRALMKLTDGYPGIGVSHEKIIEAVQKEVAQGLIAEANREDDPADLEEPSALVADLIARDRVDRRLEHVFTMLSLHLEREPLRIAFQALHNDDMRHRGTALEYLQTVLPSTIRDAVWGLIGDDKPLPEPRSAEAILADLLNASAREKGAGLDTAPPPTSTV